MKSIESDPIDLFGIIDRDRAQVGRITEGGGLKSIESDPIDSVSTILLAI